MLAGGSTPAAVYRWLAVSAANWNRWLIYFGDERCLPPEHPDRNSVMVAKAWLNQVAIPAANIHLIPAERGPQLGADAYGPLVQQARPFDLVLLGMGEDGHTASLFPGQCYDPDQPVHPVRNAPKPPADRISLSLAALNDARQVIILITGSGKHEAIQRWRNGEALPVTQVHGHAGAKVYVDALAYTGSEK